MSNYTTRSEQDTNLIQKTYTTQISNNGAQNTASTRNRDSDRHGHQIAQPASDFNRMKPTILHSQDRYYPDIQYGRAVESKGPTVVFLPRNADYTNSSQYGHESDKKFIENSFNVPAVPNQSIRNGFENINDVRHLPSGSEPKITPSRSSMLPPQKPPKPAEMRRPVSAAFTELGQKPIANISVPNQMEPSRSIKNIPKFDSAISNGSNRENSEMESPLPLFGLPSPTSSSAISEGSNSLVHSTNPKATGIEVKPTQLESISDKKLVTPPKNTFGLPNEYVRPNLKNQVSAPAKGKPALPPKPRSDSNDSKHDGDFVNRPTNQHLASQPPNNDITKGISERREYERIHTISSRLANNLEGLEQPRHNSTSNSEKERKSIERESQPSSLPIFEADSDNESSSAAEAASGVFSANTTNPTSQRDEIFPEATPKKPLIAPKPKQLQSSTKRNDSSMNGQSDQSSFTANRYSTEQTHIPPKPLPKPLLKPKHQKSADDQVVSERVISNPDAKPENATSSSNSPTDQLPLFGE